MLFWFLKVSKYNFKSQRKKTIWFWIIQKVFWNAATNPFYFITEFISTLLRNKIKFNLLWLLTFSYLPYLPFLHVFLCIFICLWIFVNVYKIKIFSYISFGLLSNGYLQIDINIPLLKAWTTKKKHIMKTSGYIQGLYYVIIIKQTERFKN